MTTWSKDLAVVDTNVLVYALYDQEKFHQACSLLLLQAGEGQVQLGLTAQVMAELYATITNPRRVSEAFSSQDALEALQTVTASLTLLPTPADVVERWFKLVKRVPVTGRDIFDIQLVATIQGNGVNRLFTYNHKDFTSFSELELLMP